MATDSMRYRTAARNGFDFIGFPDPADGAAADALGNGSK